METKLLSTDRPISIDYVFQTDVESISNIDANTRAIIFKAGKAWNAIATTIGTIDFQDSPEATAAGTIYNNKLSAVCPGHEESTPEDIASISGRKALIRITYKSGKKKLIGTMEGAPRMFIDTLSNNTTSRKLRSDWKSNTPNYWLQ